MSILGDDFRRRAEESNATAAELFSSARFATDPKVRASMIVAKLTANLLSIAGEVVDFLRGTAGTDEAAERRKAIAERSNAIRNAFVTAAATGDYSRYDQLVSELAATLAGGSASASPGGESGSEESDSAGGTG